MNLSHQPRFLPPNPFQREPVHSRKGLAGRNEELENLGYYLALTASGQSPHIALIGERGTGKTSLLNACREIAEDKDLMVVDLDLTTSNTEGQGAFWKTFYLSLLGSVADLGIEGGRQGRFFRNNLAALYGNPLAEPDDLLHFPELWSVTGGYQQGDVPSPYVVDDLRRIKSLLNQASKFGVAFLVDEANCLKNCEPILQQLRNIFQKLQGFSLVLAGTDELFDDLSEVFSPIPRQFFKLEVTAFQHWTQIQELIDISLSGDLSGIHPKQTTVRELFDLSAGDPAEVQLYLHHMYKELESNGSTHLELTPSSIKSVMDEYRANASGVTVSELDAIASLPSRLLLASEWLQRINLTAEENAEVEVLVRELKKGEPLEPVEDSDTRATVESSYAELEKLGVSLSADKLELVAASPGKSYWRSLVRARFNQPWVWSESDVSSAKVSAFVDAVTDGSNQSLSVQYSGEFRERALTQLRAGFTVRSVEPPDFFDTLTIALMARKWKAESMSVMDVVVTADERDRAVRLVAFGETCEGFSSGVMERVGQLGGILEKHSLGFRTENSVISAPPTDAEMHRLARLGGFSLPFEEFGPSLQSQAVTAFEHGHVDLAIKLLVECLSDRDDAEDRNNLGFCYATALRWKDAEREFKHAYEQSREPLVLYNLGIATAMLGDPEKGTAQIEQAYRLMMEMKDQREREEMVAMLVYREGGIEVEMRLPMDLGAALSLFSLGAAEVDFVNRAFLRLDGGNERAAGLLEKYRPK